MTTRRGFITGSALGAIGGSAVTGLLIRPPSTEDGAGGNGTPTENATPATTPVRPPELEAEVRRLVNKARHGEHGGLVPDLRVNGRLSDMAAYHSTDMAGSGYVGHSSPAGETVVDRYRKFGLVASLRDGKPKRLVEAGAENVALVEYDGGPAADVASEIVGSWTAGGEDRRWLLERSWIEHGVGVAHSDGFVYCTQNFL